MEVFGKQVKKNSDGPCSCVDPGCPPGSICFHGRDGDFPYVSVHVCTWFLDYELHHLNIGYLRKRRDRYCSRVIRDRWCNCGSITQSPDWIRCAELFL